jgi:hypothetical protein
MTDFMGCQALFAQTEDNMQTVKTYSMKTPNTSAIYFSCWKPFIAGSQIHFSVLKLSLLDELKS